MAIGAILGQTFNAGNGIDINARDILAKLSSDADNGITFGSDGGLFVEPAGGKRTCRFVIGTSTAGWTSKDCDYLCDGTDDDVEIKAAIQALPSNGGEVIILDGIYNITNLILVTKNNLTISGNGYNTCLSSNNNHYGILQISGNNITIRNLNLTAKSINYAYVNSAIMIPSGNNSILYNLYISNFGRGITCNKNSIVFNNYITNVGNGIAINGINCLVNNNYLTKGNNFTGTDRTGIFIDVDNQISQTIINNNIINNFSTGIFTRGIQQCLISNNSIYKASYGSGEYSIHLANMFGNNTEDCLVVGNLCMGKAVTDSGTNNTIVNNKYN